MRDENHPTPEALLSLPIITMAEQTQVRGHRKERVGEVVSDKMSKTIVVRVERRFRHPGVGKVVTSYGKFYAHDEGEIAGVGDLVRIQETRPLSRSKRWRLVQVLNRDGSVKAESK